MKKFVQKCKKESPDNFMKELKQYLPVPQGLEYLKIFNSFCPTLSFHRLSGKQKNTPTMFYSSLLSQWLFG
jgi:hypothetical protein